MFQIFFILTVLKLLEILHISLGDNFFSFDEISKMRYQGQKNTHDFNFQFSFGRDLRILKISSQKNHHLKISDNFYKKQVLIQQLFSVILRDFFKWKRNTNS